MVSKRPRELTAELPAGLERPRTAGLLTSPVFMALKRECMERLRDPGWLPSPSTPYPPVSAARQLQVVT
ncbi:MAG TPA: hypothetical protein VGD78_23300, partial [Chthoniobacterales bacterium]